MVKNANAQCKINSRPPPPCDETQSVLWPLISEKFIIFCELRRKYLHKRDAERSRIRMVYVAFSPSFDGFQGPVRIESVRDGSPSGLESFDRVCGNAKFSAQSRRSRQNKRFSDDLPYRSRTFVVTKTLNETVHPKRIVSAIQGCCRGHVQNLDKRIHRGE
jgi:hypothetical protein